MKHTEGKEPGNGKQPAGVSYGDMIRRSRREKGMSQEELGAIAHVGKNAVGAWEAGRSRPDLSSVPVICEALGIPIHTFFGLPEQAAPGTRAPQEEELRACSDRFLRLNDYHRQVILREMDVLIEMQGREPAPVRRLVRVYRNDLSACAGPSFGIGDDSGEPVWLYEDPLTIQADEIIRVSGDSMEPVYHDGDEVLVRHASSVRPGEIGIFTSGDAGYIKEYRKDGLHSLNPRYPVMRFRPEDEVRCAGRVIGKLAGRMIAGPADIDRFLSESRGG